MLIEELLVLVPYPYLYPIKDKLSVGEGILREGLLVLVLLPYPIPSCIPLNSQ
jgi:hypothetical protein